ncbi:MAG TPA: hypothetical protein VFO65_02130 [Acidimicrobiales bacterium]|nr:hypothetical protein [Acidimicrobiales bacterium]
MADYRLRQGAYRPDVGAFWRRDPLRRADGNPDVPSAHYEGPHGPLEVYDLEKLRVTEVRGPGREPIRLEWGPGVDGAQMERLRQGLPFRVAGVDFTLRQPARGQRRSSRQIEVDGGGRRYVARLRSFGRMTVERGDGSAVARFATARHGGRGWMDDGVDAVDVAVVVVLEGSGVTQEAIMGSLP